MSNDKAVGGLIALAISALALKQGYNVAGNAVTEVSKEIEQISLPSVEMPSMASQTFHFPDVPILTAPSMIDLGIGGTVFSITAGVTAWKMAQIFKDQEFVSLKIKPKGGMIVKPDRVGAMVKEFRQLHTFFLAKRVWIRWQITRDEEGFFTFCMIAPKKNADVVKIRIKNAYPDAVITESDVVDTPGFYDPKDGESAHLKLKKNDMSKGLNASLDNHIGDILSMMPKKSIMEITFSPSSIKPIRKKSKDAIKKLEEKQNRKNKDMTDLTNKIRERYMGNRTAFDVYIDLWSHYGVQAFMGEISAKTERLNKLRGRAYRLQSPHQLLDKPYSALAKYWNTVGWDSRARVLAKWQSSRLTDKELAPFFMFPQAGHPVWEYIRCEFPRPKVKDSDFAGDYGIGFIDSDDPTQDGRVARLSTTTMTNHGLIAGASGGGKGSTLMMLMKQDFLKKWIENKPDSMGMTLCDPHTEDILLILSMLLDLEDQGYEIPWDRIKCVSFGTIGAQQFPVAANLLHLPEGSDSTDIDKIAEDTEEIILSAFDSTNLSQSASFLKKAVQGLLYADQKKRSLLDIVRMFEYSSESDKLRKEVISKLEGKNDIVSDWWRKTSEEINESEKDKKVTAIDTRLAPLLDSKSMQRFFCREDNFFENIPKWINEGYLVLIDFKGSTKEMNQLCAAWLAKQYFTASQARGTGGRPHLLAFDEVQTFDASSIFFRILTENRKFDLGLLLLTQMVESLDDELKRAIKSNAGFVVSVRQEDGAKDMAKLLGEPFTDNELRGLEKGLEACIRSFDGKARLKLEYPAYMLNGEATKRKSQEEDQAKERAMEKFMELLERDHQTAQQADEEIKQFVYGSSVEPRPKKQQQSKITVIKKR